MPLELQDLESPEGQLSFHLNLGFAQKLVLTSLLALGLPAPCLFSGTNVTENSSLCFFPHFPLEEPCVFCGRTGWVLPNLRYFTGLGRLVLSDFGNPSFLSVSSHPPKCSPALGHLVSLRHWDCILFLALSCSLKLSMLPQAQIALSGLLINGKYLGSCWVSTGPTLKWPSETQRSNCLKPWTMQSNRPGLVLGLSVQCCQEAAL